MNVLSLFDGLSGGQIALNRAGIKYNNYYASEVDKYAIQVTQKNYPNTIQIGDVKKVNIFNVPDIDLLIGGSPCQGFSFAGKQLNFEDERSKLFFEFVRILKELAPKYFLLENVKMKKEYQDVISNLLGVEPVNINSNLASAQNRNRFYWSNIPGIEQPKDKNIYLKDIMHEKTNDYIKVSKKGRYKKYRDKSSCLTGGGNSDGNHSDMDLIGIRKNNCVQIGEALGINGHDYLKRVYADYGKSPTVTTITGGNQYSKVAVSDFEWRRLSCLECERLQTLPDNYTDVGISDTQKYKAIGNGFTIDVIAHILKGIKQKSP